MKGKFIIQSHWPLWKKIIVGLLNFLGIASLISCTGDGFFGGLFGGGLVCYYGMPNNYQLYGKVYNDVDDDDEVDQNEELEGIKVSVKRAEDQQGESTFTSQDGSFNFYVDLDGQYTVTFEDLDGKHGGGSFKTKTLSVTFDQDNISTNLGNVKLDKDEESL